VESLSYCHLSPSRQTPTSSCPVWIPDIHEGEGAKSKLGFIIHAFFSVVCIL
jgi:hypothetical protein